MSQWLKAAFVCRYNLIDLIGLSWAAHEISEGRFARAALICLMTALID
jgi:hypothetical protein